MFKASFKPCRISDEDDGDVHARTREWVQQATEATQVHAVHDVDEAAEDVAANDTGCQS